MRRKRYYSKIRRGRKRGRGIPHIYKNKVYLGKRRQTGSGVVSNVLGNLLQNVGDVIGF